MALTNEQKSAIISDYQLTGTDTGSPEVQVALLSARIDDLSGHFKSHTHDNHSRQGLLRMVNRKGNFSTILKLTKLNGIVH